MKRKAIEIQFCIQIKPRIDFPVDIIAQHHPKNYFEYWEKARSYKYERVHKTLYI